MGIGAAERKRVVDTMKLEIDARDCYLFFDCETTGLVVFDYDTDGVPVVPYVLEAAAILTDSLFAEIWRANYVFSMPAARLDEVNPHVLKMHSDNGLWAACKESKSRPEDFQNAVLAKLDEIDDGEMRVHLAGASLQALDAPVMQCHMPDLYARLHHRPLDTSSLKLAFGDVLPESRSNHRAMADAEHSLALAREYRELWRLANKD